MNDFNAQQAKQIVKSLCTNEIDNILADIKAKAQKGETVLHIYKPIKGHTVQDLKERGFNIMQLPLSQRDDLYYSIYW